MIDKLGEILDLLTIADGEANPERAWHHIDTAKRLVAELRRELRLSSEEDEVYEALKASMRGMDGKVVVYSDSIVERIDKLQRELDLHVQDDENQRSEDWAENANETGRLRGQIQAVDVRLSKHQEYVNMRLENQDNKLVNMEAKLRHAIVDSIGNTPLC